MGFEDLEDQIRQRPSPVIPPLLRDKVLTAMRRARSDPPSRLWFWAAAAAVALLWCNLQILGRSSVLVRTDAQMTSLQAQALDRRLQETFPELDEHERRRQVLLSVVTGHARAFATDLKRR